MRDLQNALAASLQAEGTGATAAAALATALSARGVRTLIVLVDDVNTQPCVISTIQKNDITNAMVLGLVYELLQRAGVSNPAPQATMAANFVVKYVRSTLK
jgi:hypothetical protein